MLFDMTRGSTKDKLRGISDKFKELDERVSKVICKCSLTKCRLLRDSKCYNGMSATCCRTIKNAKDCYIHMTRAQKSRYIAKMASEGMLCSWCKSTLRMADADIKECSFCTIIGDIKTVLGDPYDMFR